MNRFRIETECRRRLHQMPRRQLDQTVLDLLENVRHGARLLAEKTGRHDIDKLTAELLTEAAIRRPTDIHWLRVVIPAHAPELAVHLLQYFPQEDWLKATTEQGRGVKPKKRRNDDYIDEACSWRDEAEDRWVARKARADRPDANYSDRLNELVADAEWSAGACLLGHFNCQAEEHRREELINSLSAILTCLCTPDAGSAEAYEGVGGIWRDRRYGEYWPCAFDGYYAGRSPL